MTAGMWRREGRRAVACGASGPYVGVGVAFECHSAHDVVGGTRARQGRYTWRSSILLIILLVAVACACLADQLCATVAASTTEPGVAQAEGSLKGQHRRAYGRPSNSGRTRKGRGRLSRTDKILLRQDEKRKPPWKFAKVQAPDPDTDLLVIVSQPRSGTTWVNDLLTAHPCVVSIGELHSAYAYHISKDTTPHPDATREKMLWTMFTPSSTTKAFDNCKKRYIIRKLFIQSQLEFPPQSESGMNFMFDWFRSRGLKMLWLQRWNQLDRAISGRSINHGSAIHCKSNTGCANRAFALDLPGSIDKIVKSQRNLDHFSEPFRAKAREYNISVLEMQYERIKEWPQNRVSQTLFEFMGIDDTAPERHEDSDFQKRVTKTHAQMVKNLGAVCSRLKGKGLDCFCLDKMPAGGKLAGCM